MILRTCLLIMIAGSPAAFARGHEGGFRGGGGGGPHERGFNDRGFRSRSAVRWHDGAGFYNDWWDGPRHHARFRGGYFAGPEWYGGPSIIIGGLPYYYYDGPDYGSAGDYPAAAAPSQDKPDVTPATPVPDAQPAVKAQPQAAPRPITPSLDTVINVPDSSGGFTSVILTKRDKGYSGPNGEYYPAFPTPAEIKARYGK